MSGGSEHLRVSREEGEELHYQMEWYKTLLGEINHTLHPPPGATGVHHQQQQSIVDHPVDDREGKEGGSDNMALSASPSIDILLPSQQQQQRLTPNNGGGTYSQPPATQGCEDSSPPPPPPPSTTTQAAQQQELFQQPSSLSSSSSSSSGANEVQPPFDDFEMAPGAVAPAAPEEEEEKEEEEEEWVDERWGHVQHTLLTVGPGVCTRRLLRGPTLPMANGDLGVFGVGDGRPVNGGKDGERERRVDAFAGALRRELERGLVEEAPACDEEDVKRHNLELSIAMLRSRSRQARLRRRVDRSGLTARDVNVLLGGSGSGSTAASFVPDPATVAVRGARLARSMVDFRKFRRATCGGRPVAEEETRDVESEQRRHRAKAEALRKGRHKLFLSAVLEQREQVLAFSKRKRNECRSMARDSKAHLDRIARLARSKDDQTERTRLKLLKANDMEAYVELVNETKNERLKHLLEQTDEYLRNINCLVSLHQQRAGAQDEKGAAAAAATATANDEARGEKGDGGGDGAPTPSGLGPQRNSYIAETDTAIGHLKAEEVTKQPESLVGGKLKQYQLHGLQWLVSLYNNNLNGILADEMGLGKTIQAIALLTHVMEVKKNNGPFLVVVPLSTISNWMNEFAKWSPKTIVVTYKGAPQMRKHIHKQEMASGQYNVLLTTYEYILKDRSVLRKPFWQYIIVDEGHRMKNAQSKFTQTLGSAYRSRFRILLTGTPLQNSLPELWALLNFLLPDIFKSADAFDQWFNKPFANFSGSKEELSAGSDSVGTEERMLIIHRLHAVLRPFMLRRVKTEVLDQLPEKTESVLRCRLSGWQSILYRQIQLTGVASAGAGASARGLSNIIMQLRKVCNHPFLFRESWDIDDDLVRSSGKFELLDRILPKLKAAGHRVLMFSQMTLLMDILEHFFSLRGYRYLRLDGSTSSDDREQRMAQFNARDSPHFIFLLSTRAGGLGLNLATADTVVLFDSDWNPMMDAQAQDRAHRIGQKNEVRVLRLVTCSGVEEKILSRATAKLNMNELVVEAGQFKRNSQEHERRAMMESLLRVDEEPSSTSEAEDGDGGGSGGGGGVDSLVQDDNELNLILAGNPSEQALFEQLDADRDESKPRLMPESEVPDWVSVRAYARDGGEKGGGGGAAAAAEEEEEEGLGRRGRAKRDVVYNDGLTELQFCRLIEKNAKAEETAQKKKHKRKRKRADEHAATMAEDEVASLRNLCQDLRNMEDEFGQNLAQLFISLPSRRDYPDYYQITARPICLKNIEKNLRNAAYGCLAECRADFDTLFGNAYAYNEEGSWVHDSAQALQRAVNKCMDRLKAECRSGSNGGSSTYQHHP